MTVWHKTVDDLAIFGGAPAFAEKLHVGRPNVGNRARLLERINDILDSRSFTNGGTYVCEFERRVAELAGVRHCIAVCNGTVALEIAIRALGLTGEVIVPSFTFIATAHALQWQGITPVFCDIDPRTHNIDPAQVEYLITPRTTAILGVHVWGRPCDIDGLERIARRHRLKLLFDAAHALACSYHGRMIGSFGDAEIYSFHATKFVNAFEGGAVMTNDSELAGRMRLMSNFGFAGYDNVVCLGTNGKMNEPCAAMGLTTLESLEEFISINRRGYEAYRRELAGLSGIDLVTYDGTEKLNYQYVVAEVDAGKMELSRDDLVSILHAENVVARRYFHPGCHRMEPYRSRLVPTAPSLPHTEALSQRIMSLPTGTCVDPDAIASICRILRLVVTEHREVRQRLDRGKEDTETGPKDGGRRRMKPGHLRE
jgi:dTDP-4-amino-4,6-dideoxygalactose transaminase